MMAVPTNKEELQLAIRANYDKLRKELQSVPPERTTEINLEGHGKGTLMSMNNLLAYLVGWGNLVLKWIDKKDRHEPVAFPETGYKWNELGRLARKFYEDYKEDDFFTLQEKLDESVRNILTVIDQKTNHELYGTTWYEKWTLGRMIQFNTASPYANAKGRVRKWKKEKPGSRSLIFSGI